MTETINRIFNEFYVKFKTKYDVDCFVSCATKEDTLGIINCYDYVWINSLNIKEKLETENENSFYNKGGMFNKLSEEQVSNILANENETIFVSKLQDTNKINALLWLSTDTKIYDNLIFYDNVDNKKVSLINRYKQHNQIIYPIDFIALPDESNRGTAYPFLYAVYDKMFKNKYKYAFIEVYTLIGYYDKFNLYHNLNLENKRSVILNKKIGAENIGTTGVHEYIKGDYKIITKSEIYGLDLSIGIEIMRRNNCQMAYITS